MPLYYTRLLNLALKGGKDDGQKSKQDTDSSSSKNKNDCDILILGAGMSGLATAALLSHVYQNKKRIIVLEQHDVPGGCCHSFKFNGASFVAGWHYIGKLDHDITRFFYNPTQNESKNQNGPKKWKKRVG